MEGNKNVSKGGLKKNTVQEEDPTQSRIIESLMSETMREIEVLKTQRDREWQTLTGQLIEK